MSLPARVLAFVLACALLHSGVAVRAEELKPTRARAQTQTQWQVTPSLKYDALCFLNVLTGDPFYRRYYEAEYARFAPRLTPAARAALSELKRKLKDENKNIISAFLSLYFSADDGETLDEMLRALKESGRMKANLKKSVYYGESGWKLFESVRDDLKTIFLHLRDAGFESYWRQNVLPAVESKAKSIAESLSRHNVVAEVETHLGFKLPSNAVSVYVLHFSRPHGIRLLGARFITDASYPPEVVLRIAVHELLHPPFELPRDKELKAALDALRADDFLMDKILHHNPSFGYNSFESFVEEDCVRAIEQIISERLGFAADPRRRWKEEDDGMHVLAVALYELMRREGYRERRETFRDFLLRSLRTGKLSAGKIQSLYDDFYNPSVK